YDHSIRHTVFAILTATCIHFVLAGAVVATFSWYDHSIRHTVFAILTATCIHFVLAGAVVATFSP
nr:UNC-50 family protein [Tanacetum cinerariifolium]